MQYDYLTIYGKNLRFQSLFRGAQVVQVLAFPNKSRLKIGLLFLETSALTTNQEGIGGSERAGKEEYFGRRTTDTARNCFATTTTNGRLYHYNDSIALHCTHIRRR